MAADAASEFFQELGRRGHEPLLGRAKGTLGFELVDGRRTDRWLVSFDRGDIAVSQRTTGADCVVRLERSLFNALATGEANGMAAFLRGAMTVEGNPELIVLIRRLFPPRARR